VAWAKWVVPHEIGEEERKSGEIGGWPEGANVELCEEFFGKLREGRRRWVGEEEYCEFLFLCSRGLCHSLFELFSTTLQVDGWVTIFFSTPLFGQPVIVELCFTASHDVSCLLFTKLIYLNSSGRLQFHTFPISHLAISKPTISQASNPLPLKSILLLLSSSFPNHQTPSNAPQPSPRNPRRAPLPPPQRPRLPPHKSRSRPRRPRPRTHLHRGLGKRVAVVFETRLGTGGGDGGGYAQVREGGGG